MKISDKTKSTILVYAKWTALIGLPALATLWLALSGTWGVDPVLSQRIAATITSVDVFLGTVLGVSEQKATRTLMTTIQATQKEILAATNTSTDTETTTTTTTTDKDDDNEGK